MYFSVLIPRSDILLLFGLGRFHISRQTRTGCLSVTKVPVNTFAHGKLVARYPFLNKVTDRQSVIRVCRLV